MQKKSKCSELSISWRNIGNCPAHTTFFVFGHFDQNTKNGMNRTIGYNGAKAGVQKVYKPTILRHIPSFRLLTHQFLVIHMHHLFTKMQV